MSREFQFNFAVTPHLHFGMGKVHLLPSLAKGFGRGIILVTGARSFVNSAIGVQLLQHLDDEKFEVKIHSIANEPTPQMIDEAVQKFSAFNAHVVVAVGGGSVLDAGKAISAMLPLKEPVKDYLEGVGTKVSHPGMKIPFIAIPTTAGTGSEATKNAVLSETGVNGFKRSLRHDNFVPGIAIVDPELTLGCPPSITASSGMDAFTQLLESYLSTMASPITDALAFEGLKKISRSLLRAYREGDVLEARSDMALAAYLSGVTLANAGLGLVHGFASSIGGYFNISHGVVCSSLMAAANKITVDKLRAGAHGERALKKYADVGKLFSTNDNQSESFYIDCLLDTLSFYTSEMHIPRLDIPAAAFDRIIQVTENKYNPVALGKDEMMEVLEMTA